MKLRKNKEMSISRNNMTKKKKAMKKKPPTEKVKKCRLCDLNGTLSCPFCTREGLVLIGLAIVFIAWNNTYTRYIAWVLLLAAFFTPLIKDAISRR